GSNSTDNYGNNAGYAYQALMQADWIITQTERQAVLLKERFDRPAQVLRNPIDLNDSQLTGPRTSPPTPACLWIGKSDSVKRPEILIDLARQLPEFQFTMVMNRSNAEIHATIVNEAPANVQIIEKVPISQIESLFQEASFLINTSIFEGFPNTFLQAGKYGVPVVSLNVDPDDFIHKYMCGITTNGDFVQIVDGLRSLHLDTDRYQQYSKNIFNYAKDHHDLNGIGNDFNQMILDLLKSSKPSETNRQT
ncbi:MAG: glycosyltransferase family 4 protein, partial [Acidobacteriota bacterium]